MRLFPRKTTLLRDGHDVISALFVRMAVCLAISLAPICSSAPIGYDQYLKHERYNQQFYKFYSPKKSSTTQSRVEHTWDQVLSVLGGNILFIKKFAGDDNTYLGTGMGKLYKKDSQGLLSVVPVTESDDLSLTISGYSDMAVHNSTTYLGTLNGLYRSKDGMKTWEKVRSTEFENAEIYTVVSHQGTVLVATEKGVFRSDEGIIWHKTTIKQGDEPVHFLLSNGSTLLTFFGVKQITYIQTSVDNGKTWQPVTLPQDYAVYYNARRPFAAANGYFYAGAWHVVKDSSGNEEVIPVFMKSPDGRNWEQIKDPVIKTNDNFIYMDIVAVDKNETLYGVENADNGGIGLASYAIHASFPGQDSWETIDNDEYPISTMNIVDGSLVAAQAPVGIYRTYNSHTKTWSAPEGVPSAKIFSSSNTDNNLYVLADAAGQYNETSYDGYQLGSLLYIAYKGGNWILTKKPTTLGDANYVDISGLSLLVVTIDEVGMVRYSKDGGLTFQLITQPIPGPFREAAAVGFYDGAVYASTEKGIFRSKDFETWTQVHSTEPEYIIVRKFFTTPYALYAAAQYGGVIKSTDGTNWSFDNEGLTPNKTDVRTMAFTNDTMFLGGSDLFSRKAGISKWTNIGTELGALTNNSYINSIAVKGNRLFVVASKHGVYMGFVNGTGWQPLNNGLPTRLGTIIEVFDNSVILGTEDAGMFNMTIPQ